MNQTIPAGKKQPTETPAVSEDLSKAIDQTVAKQADEQVKTVRLFDDYYRCNWWVQDKNEQPSWMSSGKIRKSSFLRVKKTSSGLVIEDLGKRVPVRS
jgi:hypothetical protein